MHALPRAQIVVLSPDATEPLDSLEPDKVYVIGGLVDRSIQKNVSLDYAREHSHQARRLPITEWLATRLEPDETPHSKWCALLAAGQAFSQDVWDLASQSD